LLKRNRVIHLDGCWTLTGKSDEYVKIRLAGKIFNIHRVAGYFYLGLDIDDKKIQVLHKVECLRKGCWNPDHLYLGSQSDNMFDRVKAGTHMQASKTHCIRGHKFDQFRFKRGRVIMRRCNQCRKIYG
jgi:hypothetical protein